jgi:hypothetical protein
MTLATASGLEVAVGREVAVNRQLAGGGSGGVYSVTSLPGVVFMRYLPRTLARDPTLERRLRVMVAHPPAGWLEPRSGHVMLAWPSEVVLEDGQFVGFLMPAVDMANTVELHRVTNPSDRRTATGPHSWPSGFTWKYLVRTAANLAHATHVLHQSGVVIGDFNERNVRITRDARVTLLDCDSMQVTDPVSGERFFCLVGSPEFTPPELVYADWETTVRHPSSDLFALAIHIYQLLVEGEHPFRGAWAGRGDKPPVTELARQGIWADQRRGKLRPRPAAISIYSLLPDSIVDMFRAAFEGGAGNPTARPTADQWQQSLTDLAADIAKCDENPSHEYWAGLQRCPWCAYAAREGGHPLGMIALPPSQGWGLTPETVPVTIYLADEGIHEQVEAAVDELLATAGLHVEDRDEPISGSWFRRMRAGVKQAVHSPATQEAMLAATHAVDSRLVLAQDAHVTAVLLQNLGPVLTSLQPTKDAALRVGALLIVKVDWVVQVFQLTAAQQAILDHRPELARSPREIIEALQLSSQNGDSIP